MPLYVTMKQPCSRVICPVSVLGLAIYILVRLVQHHRTHRIAAQPDGGRSVVSRYEGFCRLINDDGASVTDA